MWRIRSCVSENIVVSRSNRCAWIRYNNPDDLLCNFSFLNWQVLLRMAVSDYFYSVINNIWDNIAPIRECRFKNNDKPWVTSYFKRVVRERNDAYMRGDVVLFRKLRNKVNRLRGKNFILNRLFHWRQLNRPNGGKQLNHYAVFLVSGQTRYRVTCIITMRV